MTTLVTPLAVFQREPRPGARFALESWNPEVTPDEVIKSTGFKFDAIGAQPTSTMSRREHQALTSLDPEGRFAAEMRS